MLFSSALFLVGFLPVFLAGYYIIPNRWRNAWLLVFSLGFYTWGAPSFVLILVISSLLDYLMASKLSKPAQKRLWLGLGVGVNVGTLLVFKYFNFFIDNIQILATSIGFQFPEYMHVALPIGISFFTFQKISYLVDVYRGNALKAPRFDQYLLFVLLFPQLIAGPIIRYKDVADQIRDRAEQEAWSFRYDGLKRFILGLSKKVLIADSLAPMADHAFGPNANVGWEMWIGLLAYAMQIFFDFSGYSDMAIGLGKMVGFRFRENFNRPYVSVGLRDFWRRWHISLGTWMRDYVYVPLGGNQQGPFRHLINLWIVFLISGLWHGASWNFVIWGAWHGLFIVLDGAELFRKLPHMITIALTFFIVTVGWVWFRADSLSSAVHFFHGLTELGHYTTVNFKASERTVLLLALLLSAIPRESNRQVLVRLRSHPNIMVGLEVFALAVLFVLTLGKLGLEGGQPFIYFRF